jgi:hypothetical protein
MNNFTGIYLYISIFLFWLAFDQTAANIVSFRAELLVSSPLATLA